MDNKIAIKTNQLCKTFGNRIAVNKLNIEIKQGEIFSLLGTNGAGKTTTIKMLSCLLQPTSGIASVMDFNIDHDPQKIKEIIGVSPQETAIAEHLNTKENLLLMGGIFGLKKEESKKRAQNLMELMELEDRRDQSRKLSGGLQRRLSIAMALMSDPQILFLDEPTLGLDPHARKSVWNYIEKLKKEKTILLTTHYLEEADALADKIAIMDEGNIIEMGTSQELKNRHSNLQILKISGDNISTEIIEILKSKDLDAAIKGNTLEVRSQDLDFYSLIDILRQNKVIINNIQMKEPSLDDVFLRLTAKEANS
ncbi:MAG: ATP-binding cassette domain-containing protein [Salinivirgaceae bacterium]|jgi:ABC-2 type transport system ATP-binding protein|nr:ATP-binding cassette domain-containing protein [Salinivirgaceae bacterium]